MSVKLLVFVVFLICQINMASSLFGVKESAFGLRCSFAAANGGAPFCKELWLSREVVRSVVKVCSALWLSDIQGPQRPLLD